MALRVAFLTGAYLLGTFPTAALVARARGHDVTAEGSGNPGATNVYRVAGRTAGVAVFAGDLAKAAIATGAGLLVDGRLFAYACGAAAVIGHCFPAQRRFKGGRGVASAGGVMIVLEPLVTLSAVAVWLVIARVARRASIASILAVPAVPAALGVIGRPATELFAQVGVAGLILTRHASNIARLVRGEEFPVALAPSPPEPEE